MKARNLAAIVAGVSILGFAFKDRAIKSIHDITHLFYTAPQEYELYVGNVRPSHSFTSAPYLSNVRVGDVIMPISRTFYEQYYYDLNIILIQEIQDSPISDETTPIKDPTAVIYEKDGMSYVFLNLEDQSDGSKLKLYKHYIKGSY